MTKKRELVKARDVLLCRDSISPDEVLVVGVEVGRPAPGHSRGLAAFAVSRKAGKYVVRSAGATESLDY